MYRVVVVDDDPRQCALLAGLVSLYPHPDGFEVTSFTSFDQLEDFLSRSGRVDICLMDVAMGGTSARFANGIEAVAELFPEGSGTQVVYVTGYAEYCTPVYETEHIYFLLKPVSAKSLNAALAKAVERLESLERAYLPVASGTVVMRLPVHKIRYLESNRRKVMLHTADDVIETYAKLSDFEEKLPDSFVRSHMSFLVNMDCIDWLDAKTIALESGERLPVSRQRSKATREAFHRYLRGRL